ncbi:MAG: tandem-95 repeat protein [Anaerolineales bacterium]|nr:tandem-95 repeat protein [Anaerolineales bacterium]
MNQNIRLLIQGSIQRVEVWPRHLMGLIFGLIVLGIMLTACGPRDSETATPEFPLPTETPVRTASIRGVVWHDLCVNADVDEALPPGCVVNDAIEKYIANGVIEPGEAGLPDVEVEIGLGPCPSFGFAAVTTDEEGRYTFEGLFPGAYCVSAKIGESHTPAYVEPGLWTEPENGMLTLTLGLGEQRSDVNFGWDYLNKPAVPTPEPTPEPKPVPSCQDSVAFIKDVTIPDGARFDPGETFRKTWRLRNNGSCTWTKDYDLVFISGYRMNGNSVMPLQGKVEPGQIVDLTVKLEAPINNGTFWGYWMLRNSRGDVFGTGEEANYPFWVKILIEPEITHWRGEYFDNRRLEGDPVLIRNDKKIDFNWKDQAPATDLPSNNFSARWTRRLKFEDAIYRFSIRVDDGARLWVDDRLVIDEWEEGATRTISVDLLMAKGKHDLKLEFFERKGKARIRLDTDKISLSSDSEWIATYWYNHSLNSKWALVKTVPTIDFDWGLGSPGTGIPKNDFSARWSRSVDFEPGIYRLYARADDGIRVRVDGEIVIDEWHTWNAGTTYTSEVPLSGSVNLTVDYFERSGKAKVSFWWEYMTSLNRPPVALSDTYEITVNDVLIVPAPGVLGNDQDPDEDRLVATLVNDASSGRVELDEDGSFVYLPDPDYVGQDEFMYKTSDGELESEITTVTLTVLPINNPPIASDDAFTVGQGETIAVPPPGVLENDFDADMQPLSALLEAEPSHGSLEFMQDGSFRYTTDPDFSGTDQFTYRASDGETTSEVALVTITVQLSNAPPVALDDQFEIEEDNILSVSAPGILANDLDPDGQPIQLLPEEGPRVGDLILRDDGSFEYTPAADFHGDDQFTYRVSDGISTSELATVSIHVLSVNDLPQAVDDVANGTQDQALAIDVLVNDLGLGDGPLAISIEVAPSEGSVEIDGDTILYTPALGFVGEDRFEYAVTDQDGDRAQAIVLITLNPPEA